MAKNPNANKPLDSDALARQNEEGKRQAEEAKRKEAIAALPEIIYLDDPEQDVERKEFTREHALRLIALQHKHGYKSWKLSKGQNLKVQNGQIVSGPDTREAEES